MKKTKIFVLLLLAAGILTIAMTSYKTPTFQDKHFLKVERQEWVIQHMTDYLPSYVFDIGITVDVPVGGSPVLIDSVMGLLNESIYLFLDDRHEPRFAPGELYCSDGKQLLQYYREAYHPYIQDTCKFCGCLPVVDYLNVTLLEQTDSFITYEVSNYFIGEGDCDYLRWVTFDKRDGHQLSQVVRKDGLLDLLKMSSGKDYDVWWDVEYRLSIESELFYSTEFGLTSDSIWCQYLYAPGIVETFPFDMKTAYPYLTEEAKKLLE